MTGRVTITVPPGWAIVAGKARVRALMRGVGNEIAARAKAMIRAGSATKKRAAKRQSAAGGPPVSRTGDLVRGIKLKLRRDGEGVTIRDIAQGKDAAFYALFLEYGAKHSGTRVRTPWFNGRENRRQASKISNRVLAPHPFMEPALDQVVANGLADRVRAAVMTGLKFQRGAK